MTLLILGLVIFLGVHSTRVFGEGWRSAQLARMGEKGWKGAYSLASLLGLVLLVWGYSLARQSPVALWTPVIGLRHLASLLTVFSFILLAAAYVPRNSVKARIGHPMVAGVKLWALAHLLANHTLADLLLFGGFLVWAVLCFRAARGRPQLPRHALTLTWARASRPALGSLVARASTPASVARDTTAAQARDSRRAARGRRN